MNSRRRIGCDGEPCGLEVWPVDMAFNNAGIQVPPSDAADEHIENFERVAAVNQRGVWACMKHELRVMRRESSTVRRLAVSSAYRSAQPTTAPSTPCSK
jgi:NAD(P)-dependent dehydrogenase (short-subunit alcohol dehydrogenase family)